MLRSLSILLVLLVAWLSSPTLAAEAEWSVEDAPTQVLPPPTPPDDFVRVDGERVVAWGPADKRGSLEHLATIGSASIPRLAQQLGVAPVDRVYLYLAPTEELFYALQPGEPPEWADATAWPAYASVFLRTREARGVANSDPIEQVLDHELVHILLGRAFAPAHPPTWLNEGLATVLAGEYGPQTIDLLDRASLAGAVVPLEQLAYGFPRHRGRSAVAYAESADFVAWFRATYGEDALRELIGQLRSGNDLQGALRTTTGLYPAEVDTAWRGRLASGGLDWLLLLTSTDAVWIGMGLLAVVALVVARGRQERRKAAYILAERKREVALDAVWEDAFVHDVRTGAGRWWSHLQHTVDQGVRSAPYREQPRNGGDDAWRTDDPQGGARS